VCDPLLPAGGGGERGSQTRNRAAHAGTPLSRSWEQARRTLLPTRARCPSAFRWPVDRGVVVEKTMAPVPP